MDGWRHQPDTTHSNHGDIMTTPTEQLALARLSLEGLSVGDALGGFFELSSSSQPSHFITNRVPPSGEWRFTDDTNMALSIYAVLRTHGYVDQDALADSFITHYNRSRGYGRGMRALVARIQNGLHWREASRSFYGGQGSYGNGGAMRASLIGAYFADDLSAVVSNAQASAEVTHAHPEGINGAIAVALAASIAYQTRNDPGIPPKQFIERVIQHLPDGEVRQGCIDAANLPDSTTISQAAEHLGNGMDMSAQRTVPFAIWCATMYRHDFEEAIWQSVSAGGDTDTTCAIIGGIVSLVAGYDGIPQDWLDKREPLPSWPFS